MDFIERIFGICPDGGSGALEALAVLVPMMGAAAVWRVLRVRHRRR
ncbi:MAG TPA: hypothetical protein VFT22_22575 [Kofleriaceae bacterium]|nr:hypothetical protein [Kofleriaceae bacterium]